VVQEISAAKETRGRFFAVAVADLALTGTYFN